MLSESQNNGRMSCLWLLESEAFTALCGSHRGANVQRPLKRTQRALVQQLRFTAGHYTMMNGLLTTCPLVACQNHPSSQQPTFFRRPFRRAALFSVCVPHVENMMLQRSDALLCFSTSPPLIDLFLFFYKKSDELWWKWKFHQIECNN